MSFCVGLSLSAMLIAPQLIIAAKG